MTKNNSFKISVIIVNYNVEFFLEQCLNSVQKALEKVNGQVFIVDNNSIDGSVEMVQRKFPQYNLIANKDNKGFSKANNQGILLSNAEYILLLNPDTVVEEDGWLRNWNSGPNLTATFWLVSEQPEDGPTILE